MLASVTIHGHIAHSYDQLSYESYPFPETHPAHLYAIARFYGMEPARLENARVLEIGCAGGGNIIPLALRTPGAEFLGIDLSAKQIAQGKAIIDRLGLANIELKVLDLVNFEDSFGEFDYIIAHGVFSWIPQHTQDALLSLLGTRLRSQGVAYVSYNALPGWHMGQSLRELLRYHVGGDENVRVCVAHAREILELLSESLSLSPVASDMAKLEAVNKLLDMPDWYIFHEYLALDNHPCLVSSFLQRAESHGLQYIADADLSITSDDILEGDLKEKLSKYSSTRVQREQYIDFFSNRLMRRSVLCRSAVELCQQPLADKIAEFWLASPARLLGPGTDSAEMDSDVGVGEVFEIPGRGTITCQNRLTAAAFRHLSQIWPESIEFEQLYHIAHDLVPEDCDSQSKQELCFALQQMFFKGVLKLDQGRLPYTSDISECPKVDPLVQVEAQMRTRVTSGRHEYVLLDEFTCAVLEHLDGYSDKQLVFKKLKKRKRTNLTVESGSKTTQINLKKIDKASFFEWWEHVMPELARRGVLLKA